MGAIRVAAVTYDYYPFDVRVRRLAEAAADAGCEMDVICLRDEGECERETYNGVDVYRLAMGRGFGKSLPRTVLDWSLFMLRAGALLTRLHLRRRYDVVHVHNMPDFLVFSALLPKLLGARVILDVQDVSPELMTAKAHGKGARARSVLFRLAALQERISAWFVDSVVTVGWPFEEKLLGRGVPKRKLAIVLNSADPKLFPPERRCPPPNLDGDPTQPFIVMYWGTLAERNGLDVALRAVALARAEVPNVRLDIMGRGEQVPVLKALAAELGIADQVRFSDPVPAEQIVDFVVHGDVGIIPYRVDGFAELVLPTKAYELAWMHRPIIASDTVAIRSMFRPVSLRLCPPEDSRAFADAIITLARDPQRRAELVAAAAEDYVPYEWEAMAARYAELLATLSGKPARPQTAPATIEPAPAAR
ncbi:MAG TPA: glycosyltransferase family 4 protein [Ktedonobacterales bacterium]|nr:glycosyltransferase family 4 protein [Ktedonobacterales bacterium]